MPVAPPQPRRCTDQPGRGHAQHFQTTHTGNRPPPVLVTFFFDCNALFSDLFEYPGGVTNTNSQKHIRAQAAAGHGSEIPSFRFCEFLIFLKKGEDFSLRHLFNLCHQRTELHQSKVETQKPKPKTKQKKEKAGGQKRPGHLPTLYRQLIRCGRHAARKVLPLTQHSRVVDIRQSDLVNRPTREFHCSGVGRLVLITHGLTFTHTFTLYSV